ncbi:MAG TPA: DoxX family protein [Fontimonas sp.]
MNGKTLGLAVVFLFFLIGGIAHFAVTDFFVRIMPPYIPFPREAVLLSGAVELILAFCLLKPSLRPLTGWALIALICVVSTANIHMSMNPELFPEIPEWALTLRLFIQAGLLWLVWWSTRPAPQRT